MGFKRLQHQNTEAAAGQYRACPDDRSARIVSAGVLGGRKSLTGITEYVLELERRLSAGEAFAEIEDWVQDLRAPEDVKAALWLLAWTEQERATQRRVVCEALGHLADARA